MDDIIAALTILRQYGNPKFPFTCEHDTLYIHGIHPSVVDADDLATLDRLGIQVHEDGNYFVSTRFGSC